MIVRWGREMHCDLALRMPKPVLQACRALVPPD